VYSVYDLKFGVSIIEFVVCSNSNCDVMMLHCILCDIMKLCCFMCIFVNSSMKTLDATDSSLPDLHIIANQTTGRLPQVCACCSC